MLVNLDGTQSLSRITSRTALPVTEHFIAVAGHCAVPATRSIVVQVCQFRDDPSLIESVVGDGWIDEVPSAWADERLYVRNVGRIEPIQIVVGLLFETGRFQAAREPAILLIIRKHLARGSGLFKIVEIGDALGFFLRLGQRRKKQRRKDSDDRDHHQ